MMPPRVLIPGLTHPLCLSGEWLLNGQGIEGHGFYDECVVPIIENTARECQLTERLREAIMAYPKSNAVLVRRHGVYIWGKTWMQVRVAWPCLFTFETTQLCCMGSTRFSRAPQSLRLCLKSLPPWSALEPALPCPSSANVCLFSSFCRLP